MQIVYISNRRDMAQETLACVENLMPFITEAVFVCPSDQVSRFSLNSRIPVTVLDESTVLGPDLSRFEHTTDHQHKNCLLRFSLSRSNAIGEEFIMSDDDNRPLATIPLSFYKASNRYFAYYYYDMKQWPGRETHYDEGQRRTAAILEEKGFPTLSYSSHMPQIINKALLGQTSSAFKDVLNKGAPLDEWSAYFNYGQTLFPERFQPPEPFRTLCWPAFPSDWDWVVRPNDFFFENFYPLLYEKGMIFSDLPTFFDASRHFAVTREKIRRRTALQEDYERGRIPFHGKLFFLARNLAGRFPPFKRRLNRWLSPSKQAALLQFFSSRSSRWKGEKSPISHSGDGAVPE